MISSYKGPNICAYSRVFLLQLSVLPLALSSERLETLKPLIHKIELLARRIYCKTDHVASETANSAHMCTSARERARVSFACTGTAVATLDLSQGNKWTP